MAQDRDYVLGTHDVEIARLGLQHAVWRPRALDAWRRAGITRGQRIIDFGAGPGYAALDLADVVGPEGEVWALERSRRFLDHLDAVCQQRALSNIRTFECDLDRDALPVSGADAAWARWIFAFLPRPKAALAKLVAALKPGGLLVIHEYLDYSTWKLAERSSGFEDFVANVMATWRSSGGEPDIGRDIPAWLIEAGLDVSVSPIVDVISPKSFTWAWPASFIESNAARQQELGMLTPAQAQAVRDVFAAAEANPHTLMTTPIVAEIIARKPLL